MCKGKFFRVQKKSPERPDSVSNVDVGNGFVAALVVDLVTDDGVVDVCHVDAYLVSAAGFDLDIEQGEFFITLSDIPQRERTATVGGDLHPQTVVFVAADGSLNSPGVLLERPVDEGNISFINLAIAKLIGQSFLYLLGFGNNDQPRSVFVEAVDYARTV